jgi:hypothetical protein
MQFDYLPEIEIPTNEAKCSTEIEATRREPTNERDNVLLYLSMVLPIY